ncbi:alpha/beta hydrolase family protein [Crocinitomix catalasitica]|uniref:alpha/beta hydrolase family protein n=1 Tax=Crocinitomix catalasitica TaxID=184607 RepID=UPI000484A32E|nr:S9 family peptidase [Crocinitomix catalasitica]
MKTIRLSILTFAIVMISTISTAQDYSGSWKGAITTQGIELELIFDISETDEGYSSTLDVPMQGASGIPIDKTIVEDGQITFTSATVQFKYVAKMEDNDLSGTFYQNGMELPLVLSKTVKTLPGNTALPTTSADLAKLAAKESGPFKYSVEDYFKNPDAASFQLSPNGEYLSYLKRNDEGKNTLFIKNTATDKELAILKDGEDIIKGYFWATNERILYLKDKGGDENFHVFGINIDGSNDKELTPFDGVKANILESLKDDKEHIIISLNKDNKQQEEPYKLNINTGKLTKLYTFKEGEAPVAGYTFDKDGELRIITRLINGVDQSIDYKIDGEMKNLMTVEFGNAFNVIEFNYETENPNDAYVASNLSSDKTVIQLYDLKAKKVIKEIHSDKTYDVSSIRLSRKRGFEIDYIMVNAEKVRIIPISETYKKVQARLKKEFGDKQFYTTYRSDDENVQMIVVTSDKIVAEYYIYNVKEDKVKLLYKVLPHLKESDMAEMRPIKFQSRDGKTIYGYITLPKAALNGEKVPLIVMPHGGPQGVRDSWGFNPENQLFASRGYATLNVNFRISGGYGKEFMNSGFKQIGRAAMDDVEDGLAYVIQQGWVNKDKVAIYGASHGGYAVLRGMTKTPELYACGVDYVGVSNLNTFMESIPAYWEKYRALLYETWYDPNIPEEKIIMDEISPALHTDKIVKPLFVVQGANDPRVNINEADQIVEKLRARNIDVPYMVKYDEGHGFYKEENRIELYTTMMGFFAEHLK